MPSQIERVSLAEFTITTGADEARILETIERGLAASKPAMGSAPKEVDTGADRRTYAVRGTGGLMELMRFTISWEPADGDGAYQVKLRSGEFTTTQSKLLMLVPIGPKEVPGLKHLERFGKFVRAELEVKREAA